MSEARLPARTNEADGALAARHDGTVVVLRPQDDVAAPPRRRRIGWKLASFLAVAVLPTLLAALYFGLIASDQYVAEARFGIRSGEKQAGEAGGTLGSSISATLIGLESNVVVQYALSRQIVDALESGVGLRRRYARPEVDLFSRLDRTGSAEDLVDYWRGKAYAFFDLTTGSVVLRVKAFTPDDAETLTKEVVRLSEVLVNDMARRALDDAVGSAKADVARAEDRLKRSQAAIAAFRAKEQVLDPSKQADANLGLVGKLKEDLARYEAQYRTNRSLVADNSPSQRVLADRIAGLRDQIRAIDARLPAQRSAGAEDDLGRTMVEYDALETEKKLAERSYETTLDTLQKAQVAANRQSIYLQVFVRPSLPERPLFPRRLEATALTALAGLGAWILGLLVVASIRDHL